MKFGIAETCERIKEEFNMIQNQYHSLKLDCEKLAQEKQEMQRHYIMVSQFFCQCCFHRQSYRTFENQIFNALFQSHWR